MTSVGLVRAGNGIRRDPANARPHLNPVTEEGVAMAHESSVSRRKNKPQKPDPEFLLFTRQTGHCMKRIGGEFQYFGPWDGPDAAPQKYLDQDQKGELHAGRTAKSFVWTRAAVPLVRPV